VPPNATISVLDKAKGDLATAVVVLKAPRLNGDRLTFDAIRLHGDLGDADGPASIFIDVVNVPLARLTSRHGGWYAGSKKRSGGHFLGRRWSCWQCSWVASIGEGSANRSRHAD
jgi:hypothetical protein